MQRESSLPGPCALCLADAADLLCDGCVADLPRLHGACIRCGALFHERACTACLVDPPPWRQLVAPFHFSYPVDRLVHRFKYEGRLAAGRFLAREMARCVAAAAGSLPDLLVAVPIHPSRLAARGFNQSLELARRLAREFGIPVSADALRRTDARPSLVGLGASERRRHVRGAFALSAPALPARRIAIVDDILTTGATAREISRTLAKAGAEHIEIWVAARTPY
jgi:ComF family protein